MANRRTRSVGTTILAVVILVILVVVAKSGGPDDRGTSGAASMAPARSVFAQRSPVTISVLGDSTGNDIGEWVDLWARHLAGSHVVVLHQWDSVSEAWKPQPITYGNTGPRLTIWNGSQPGAAASYPAYRLGRMQPERPDLVLYSFAHNDTAATVVDGLVATIDAVDRRWGSEIRSVVILQNPGLNAHGPVQDSTLAALKRWADDSHQPTIDVTSEFRKSRDLSALQDDAHPNAAGSQLWEETVAKALS